MKWLGCPPCIYGAHCKLAEPELRGFFFDIVHSTHSLIIGIYANQKVRTYALYSLGMPFVIFANLHESHNEKRKDILTWTKVSIVLTTVKPGDKERFDKEQIGVKEPFPVTKC